jgi:hypothetical protein
MPGNSRNQLRSKSVVACDLGALGTPPTDHESACSTWRADARHTYAQRHDGSHPRTKERNTAFAAPHARSAASSAWSARDRVSWRVIPGSRSRASVRHIH